MTTNAESLDFYRKPGRMTDPAQYGDAIRGLPSDSGELANLLHGLVIHEHMLCMYGVSVSDDRRAEVHNREVTSLLGCMHARGTDPLESGLAPADRFVGDCRHISVLLVTMLRAQSVPARARCGFGGYFDVKTWADHWVGEYWNATEERWVLVDAQIDSVQREHFGITFDVLDVPRDEFVVAGRAWLDCREGKVDPGDYGIMQMSGLGFIAGNVMRDFASLNRVEMLPWDVWGAMPPIDAPMTDEQVALIDRLSQLTLDADANFAALRNAYTTDSRDFDPGVVFNAVLGRKESVYR